MTKPPHIPEFLLQIQPYLPGKPIEEVEREIGVTAIKLASNENPLGPSPLAVEAMGRAAAEANRYPDGACYYLRERLAHDLRVPPNFLAFGAGSSELIMNSARAFLREGDEGLTSQATFPMYAMAIQGSGARLVEIPLLDNGFDLEAMAAAVTPRTRAVYLSNPNNPTGTWFSADELQKFLDHIREDILVVLDEAYFDYVDAPGYSRSFDLVREGRNLLVLRTFSKVHGLAGLRMGYGIARPEIVGALDLVRHPFNTSIIAQAGALAALDDVEHVRRSLAMNREGLVCLSRGLHELRVQFVPSVANFLLLDLETDGKAVADALLPLGVVVRPMGWMGLPSAIRVTVGTHAENEKFLAALAQTLAAMRHARVSRA